MLQGKTVFLLALLLTAAIGSHQAEAGMSGMSDRVQRLNAAEAQAALPPPAKPVVQAPSRPVPVRPEQSAKPSSAKPSVGAFDGTWTISSSPGCDLAARSAVQVSRGRIVGQGVSGSVDANGNVRTSGYGEGISVVSQGRVSGAAGSGTYSVSNGCTGTWVAHKA